MVIVNAAYPTEYRVVRTPDFHYGWEYELKGRSPQTGKWAHFFTNLNPQHIVHYLRALGFEGKIPFHEKGARQPYAVA